MLQWAESIIFTPQAVGGVLASMIGAFAAYLWTRYNNRMAVLRWSATHQAIAVSTNLYAIGQLRVMWGVAEVEAMHAVFIEVENTSSRDLVNVPMNFSLNSGSDVFFAGPGQHSMTGAFPWSQRFTQALDRLAAIPDGDPVPEADRHLVTYNREIVVPVINRGSQLVVSFGVTAPAGYVPQVSLAVEHPGVRLRYQGRAPMFFGVRQGQAVAIGLIAGSASCAALALSGWHPGAVAFLSFLVGAAGTVVGAVIVRLWRLLRRVLG